MGHECSYLNYTKIIFMHAWLFFCFVLLAAAEVRLWFFCSGFVGVCGFPYLLPALYGQGGGVRFASLFQVR